MKSQSCKSYGTNRINLSLSFVKYLFICASPISLYKIPQDYWKINSYLSIHGNLYRKSMWQFSLSVSLLQIEYHWRCGIWFYEPSKLTSGQAEI